MARESELIRNGGGLIDVSLCDGFLYWCSPIYRWGDVQFPQLLNLAFSALNHVWKVGRWAGNVMPYTFLLVSREESLRRGSLFNQTARVTPSVVTDTDTTETGGWLIDCTLCDGFLYWVSVFFKSIAEATFSFSYVWDFTDFCIIFIDSEEEKSYNGENTPPFGSKTPNMTTS